MQPCTLLCLLNIFVYVCTCLCVGACVCKFTCMYAHMHTHSVETTGNPECCSSDNFTIPPLFFHRQNYSLDWNLLSSIGYVASELQDPRVSDSSTLGSHIYSSIPVLLHGFQGIKLWPSSAHFTKWSTFRVLFCPHVSSLLNGQTPGPHLYTSFCYYSIQFAILL